ncbi:MAG: C40 family peptidase [Muribaculaceae bacterium]|nr:C40 family peptidase [Muribaculaceae bacterium]
MNRSIQGLHIIATVAVVLLLLGGCRSHSSVRFPGAAQGGAPVNVEFARLSKERRQLIEEAQSWIGTPYKYAESTKHRGSDCSGMVVSVYLDALGIKLPRNSAQQAEFCRPVQLRQVLPGDLVFFATGKDQSKISHVGIMLDYENFIHVSTSKGVVISKITTPYYTSRFMGFGKVPGL